MVTLTEFLLARIAEDEAAAQAAARDGYGAIDWAGESGPTDVHIARHDPARVLAECEAKRRIVERPLSTCGDYAEPGSEWREDYEQRGVKHIPDDYAPWPCDGCSAAESVNHDHHWTLAVLALPFADHPDYREEWRP